MKKNIAVGAAAFIAVGAVGLGAFALSDEGDNAANADTVPVAEVSTDDVVSTDRLSQEAVLDMLEAAVEEAEAQDQRVTVAVVDRDGNTIGQVTMTGAGPQTEDSAVRKAFTAVGWNSPTGELTDAATGDGPTIDDIGNTLFLTGGVPVSHDGAPIAGIGVGGAPSGDIDEEIALAGLEALDTE
ncbi:GlcG/HbpS family heme-binding protein [Haloglycomyces albus]|uniref:GlcG/HbpS family heme-binding protein n=1 Tax=Haloglycomyces albus TaxID=526067 RepID=UPI00046CEF83|nr:heme-binding protein [Haloglycomyces albus]